MVALPGATRNRLDSMDTAGHEIWDYDMNYDAFSGGIEGYIERDGGVLLGGFSTRSPPLIIATTDGGLSIEDTEGR